MSIIIKGMEMPTNCWLCPLSVLYEKPREMLLCRITKEEVLRNKVDGNCPLVEVPKHGRLIDADALVKSMRDFSYMWGERMNDEWVGEAPTIIESEGEDESR